MVIIMQEKLIIYLENQQDNKIICENCGVPLHFIDKYCYNCGQEQTTKITIIELLSSINSTYIKPGDIIRIKSGYYVMPDSDYSEEEMILSQFPDGVLTMQSALFLYGYIEERPRECS